MTAYGVRNWNASSKRHVTLVALDGLATRGRPQTEARPLFGKRRRALPLLWALRSWAFLSVANGRILASSLGGKSHKC
jgi:hypothetical protein